MPNNIVSVPYEYFADPDRGRPLFNAQIFVGQPDLDPEVPANQKQVTARQEDGTEVSIPQPIRTGSGGYPVLNGNPVVLLVDGAYSIKVLDRSGALMLESPNVTNGTPITNVTISDFTNVEYKESAGSSPIQNMINGNPILASVGDVVSTTGFNEDGDGGAATYIIESGNSGDGIARHNVGANTAVLIDDGGRVKAEQLGIRRDNNTALNADIFTYASLNYDELLLGDGQYRIEKPCFFNKRIRGVGKRLTFIVTDNDIDGSFRYDASHGPTSLHLNDLTICSRAYIDTPNTHDTSGTGLWLTGRPVFKNVEVFGYGDTCVLVPGDTKPGSFIYRLLLGSFEHCNFQFGGNGFELIHTQIGGNFTTTSTWKDCYIASCDVGFKATGLVASEFDNMVFEFCTLGADINGGRVKVSKWYFEQCVTPYDFNTVVSTIMTELITGNTNDPIVVRNRSNQPQAAISYVQPSNVSSQRLGLLWDNPSSPIAETSQNNASIGIGASSLGPMIVENMPTRSGESGQAQVPVIHGDGSKMITLKIASDGTLAYPSAYVLSVSRAAQGIYEVSFQDSVRLTFAQATPVVQFNAASAGNTASIQMIELVAPNNNWTRFRTSPYTITGFRINVTNSSAALVDSELLVMMIIDV